MLVMHALKVPIGIGLSAKVSEVRVPSFTLEARSKVTFPTESPTMIS